MVGQALVDGPQHPPAGTRRSEVLAWLRSVGTPHSAAEVARGTGVHVNTARLHLDALARDGLVERRGETRDTPGRPRILYSAQGPVPGPRSFLLLAEILTGLVSSLEGGSDVAIETGEAWGRHLVDRPPPSRPLTTEEALVRIGSMLSDLGFQPDPATVGGEPEVTLRNCPFREIAEMHSEVVCGLHLGFIQGGLDELRAPLHATSLEPFVTPQTCIARFRT